MRRFYLALGGVAMLVVTACGSSGHRADSVPPVATAPPSTAGPVATSSTDPTTTLPATTTTVPDTAIVPATITVAYVDAVLAKLNHIYGDAVRASVAAHALTFDADKDLGAIYTVSLAAEEHILFAEALANETQNVRKVPGDPITSVQKLIYASTTCIYAQVQTDSDPVVIHPVAPLADEFMGLRRITAGADLVGLNHTPWIWFFDGVTKTASKVPNQCHTE
jgi:hypothetical protein